MESSKPSFDPMTAMQVEAAVASIGHPYKLRFIDKKSTRTILTCERRESLRSRALRTFPYIATVRI